MFCQIILRYFSKKHPLTLFLISVLIAGYFNAISSEYAQAVDWEVSVEPSSQNCYPGSKVEYLISVTGSLDDPQDILVVFYHDPYGDNHGIEVRINGGQSVEGRPPFTASMIVEVKPDVTPGTYYLMISAASGIMASGYSYINAELIVDLIDIIDFNATSTPSSPPPSALPPLDFSLDLSPPSLTVETGQMANYQILLTYSDPSYAGTIVTIQVTGLGPGMTYQLTSHGGLTISTSQSTALGTYQINVIGSALGVTRQTSGSLIVTTEGASTQPPSPNATSTTTTETSSDFSISISPNDRSVFRGEDPAVFIVTIEKVGEFDQPVTLQTLGLPSDAIPSFSPASGKAPFSTTLTIDATNSTPPGTYTITVDASGGGKSHSATISLTIKEKSGETTSPEVNPQVEENENPEEGLSFQDYLIIILVVALVIVSIAVLMAKRKPSTVARTPTTTKHCINCGVALTPGKTFCGSCGERIE
jgi:hypothetical protein